MPTKKTKRHRNKKLYEKKRKDRLTVRKQLHNSYISVWCVSLFEILVVGPVFNCWIVVLKCGYERICSWQPNRTCFGDGWLFVDIVRLPLLELLIALPVVSNVWKELHSINVDLFKCFFDDAVVISLYNQSG